MTQFRITILLIGLLALQGCPFGAVSDDPATAAKQEWVKGCKVADQNLRTTTLLWKAGKLPVGSATKIGQALDLYEAICTGDPPLPGEPIASSVVKLLAAKVCPGMVPTNVDDWLLTAIDAAACVAEGALLAEGG